MSILRNALGLIVGAILVVGYLSYFIVNEKQKAIVQRLGQINRIVE